MHDNNDYLGYRLMLKTILEDLYSSVKIIKTFGESSSENLIFDIN